MAGGTAIGVYNLEHFGQYGSKHVISVPSSKPRIEQDFSKKAELTDAGMFIGPLVICSTIG